MVQSFELYKKAPYLGINKLKLKFGLDLQHKNRHLKETGERSISPSHHDDDVIDDNDKVDSSRSVKNFKMDITEKLMEECASQLSCYDRMAGLKTQSEEWATHKAAMEIAERKNMRDTLELLIKRNADLTVSQVPLAVLFFAIKAADVDMVRLLLSRGASPLVSLSEQKGLLYPLHIAVAVRGEDGIAMTQLLLDALADPNARALEDDSYMDMATVTEWIGDDITEECLELLGGRTPLHIACNRDDNKKECHEVVKLLLHHKVNPHLLCNGYSPLALAIASGNDLIIYELLAYGADPSQVLTHGVGNALCVIFHTKFEHRWPIDQRLRIIDKLIEAGADILALVPIGSKRTMGTAVDYAHHIYNLDRRIAHMPYHSLTTAEREIFNNRRKLLSHIGGIARKKAIEREKRLLAEAGLSPDGKRKGSLLPGMKLPKSCYYCSRTMNVRLSPCPRCKCVYYCSKICKTNAWNEFHKDECAQMLKSTLTSMKGQRGRSISPSQLQVGKDVTGPIQKPKVPLKFCGKLAQCYRNPKCDIDHRSFFKNQSGVCLQHSLGFYVDNYSFV